MNARETRGEGHRRPARTAPNRQAEVIDFEEFIKVRSPSAVEPRPYGLCAGEIQVPDDFDTPLPDSELGLFEQ